MDAGERIDGRERPTSFVAALSCRLQPSYVGKTALQNGDGVMTGYEYLDGAAFQPSDDEVRKRRPADAQ